MRKRKLFISVMLFLSLQSSAQWLQPTLRFTATATFPKNNLQVVSGLFDVETRRVNFGFEITNEFRLHKKLLIETGLRYTPVKTTVRGLNVSSDFLARPNPFTWSRSFGSLTFPVLYTRYFKTKNNRVGKYFIGFAVGVFVHNSYMYGGSSSFPVSDSAAMDTIIYSGVASSDFEVDQFYGTVDIGIKYHPFKKSKNFEIGLLITYQLNRNRIGSQNATIENVSKNQFILYQSTLYQKITNISLSIGYKFGANKKKKRNDISDCPKN